MQNQYLQAISGNLGKYLKTEELPIKKRTTKVFQIDNTDKKILNILNKDSSLPYHTIATKLNLSIDIVRYRIKKLLKNEIIIKFFPEISLLKLGYTKYLYKIKLKNLSKIKVDKLEGKVTKISFLETQIETKKGDTIHIPNSTITKKEFIVKK